ncbi:MAG: (2Fe-2S)-binding protein [SAR324 cluster bacterium]|nr:(2Fe-2S)-binding protein [SAR324 cluster bacterium]
MKTLLKLKVNGEHYETYTSIHKTLLEVLREDLGLTGTRHGCELGECGVCSVLIDGQPKLSCLVLPIEVQEQAITTIEGMATGTRFHPLQEAFADLGAAQCGFCMSGMLLSAKAMLDENPQPTRAQIREELAGNLCRCTGYTKIIEAIEKVVAESNA